MQHLDDGTLHAWLDRDRSGLTAAQSAEIAAHLGVCPACAGRMDEARGLAGRSAAILAGAAPSVVPPAFSEIQARAAGVGGAAPTPRQRPWLSLGWAASIALALGLGWLGRGLVPGGEAAIESGAPGAGGARLAVAPAELPPPVVGIETPAPTEPREEAAAPAPLPSQGRMVLAEDAAPQTEDRVADAAPTDRAIAPTAFDDGAARAGQEAVSDLPPPPATSGLRALQEIVATGRVDPVEGARSPISIAPVTRETMPAAVVSWIPADPDEAARTFGAPIVFVPDLPVVEVEIGRLDGARAVRVVQEHPYGLLTLVQVRAAESTEPGSAALATGTVTLIVEEMRITGAGPLPADTVRALLERIR